jgi:hypothetical protein
VTEDAAMTLVWDCQDTSECERERAPDGPAATRSAAVRCIERRVLLS